MKNYHLYEVNDFVLDDDFVRWVYEPAAADDAFWEDWLKQHPEKQLVIAEARQVLHSIRVSPEKITQQTIAQEVEKLLRTIKVQWNNGYRTPFTFKWWLVAAFLMMLVGVVLATLCLHRDEARNSRFSFRSVTASQQLVEQINPSGKPIMGSLPDATVVMLSPNSRISYPNGFDSMATRDVYLSGKAFFEVTKDALHPFRVFTGEIITKVVGTSFSITSFENDKNIEITVRTGRVSVYSQQLNTRDKKTTSTHKLEGIIITPNQHLIYKREQQKFEKELLQKPVIVAPDLMPQAMIYEDAPLIKVLKDISKAYGITIHYDADLLKNCTLTADLSDEALYTKLKLICKAIDGGYEVIRCTNHYSGGRLPLTET